MKWCDCGMEVITGHETNAVGGDDIIFFILVTLTVNSSSSYISLQPLTITVILIFPCCNFTISVCFVPLSVLGEESLPLWLILRFLNKCI